MKASIVIKTKHYLVCPKCGCDTDSSIDHLRTPEQISSFGHWYCNECGIGITGKVLPDGDIDLEFKEDDRKIDTLDLVMIPANLPKPFYRLVSRDAFVMMNDVDRSIYTRSVWCDVFGFHFIYHRGARISVRLSGRQWEVY